VGAEKLSKTATGILATLQGYRGSLMRSKISEHINDNFSK